MEGPLAFLLFHGGVESTHVGGHARAPVELHELGVYDRCKASYLLCSRGSCISCSGGGIRCGVRGNLRVRIWCEFTSILPLATAVLWLGAASLDSFGDLAYSCLCDPV
jgi:hypothetical protein